MSSPEQLDKAITIISPSFWIAAAGGGLIIAIALIWSIIGRLPVNVSANGIYMGMDGMHSVVAEADGIFGALGVFRRDLEELFLWISGGRYTGGRLENYMKEGEDPDGIAGWITSVLKEFDTMIAQASGMDVFGIMLLLGDSFERIMNRRER